MSIKAEVPNVTKQGATEHRSIDTVVIGGGQTGLTVGYFLKQQRRDFVILDAGRRVGEAWRNRWDSLRLFTPSRIDALPGMRFPKPGSMYPTKDEMANFLEAYATRFDLPVRLGARVVGLSRNGDGFIVSTSDVDYQAKNVIVAMGNYQSPRVPPFAKELNPSITQIHSKNYRNPAQLQPGPVLVVGVGNSGGEIALEVSKLHPTVLAGKETATIPWRVDSALARHVITRIQKFVFLHVLTINTPIGRKVRPKILSLAAPLIRVKPKDLISAGVERVGRITGAKEGFPVTEDGRVLQVRNVIWCTGFRPGFSWIDLPIFGERGEPNHERGVVTSEPGLYFVGLHFQFSIGSDSIPGHQRDAKYVVQHLSRNRSVATMSESMISA